MSAKGRAKAVDIYVWDYDTMEIVSHLISASQGSIRQVKFNIDGTKLVSVREDNDNNATLWDWKNKRALNTQKVDQAAVSDLAWDAVDPNSFVTVGPRHIKFWGVNGTNMGGTQGKWKGNSFTDGKVLPLISCQPVKGICYTGTCNGDILVWQGGSIMQSKPGHEKQVFSIHYSQKRKSLITGCSGGRLIEWNIDGNKLGAQKIVCEMSQFSSFIPGIKSIDTNSSNGHLLIGTKASELYILKNKEGSKPKNIMMGHFEENKPKPSSVAKGKESDHRSEVWGLAVSPGDESLYVTSGGDFTIRLWSATKKI
jgi:WD40 repeat protein